MDTTTIRAPHQNVPAEVDYISFDSSSPNIHLSMRGLTTKAVGWSPLLAFDVDT